MTVKAAGQVHHHPGAGSAAQASRKGEAHTPGEAMHVRWHVERVSLLSLPRRVTLSPLLSSWGPRSVIRKMDNSDAAL